MSLIIEQGITIGGGITFGALPPPPAFTINLVDITNEGASGVNVYSSGSGSWFVTGGAFISSAIYFEAVTGGTLASWYAQFASAGFNSSDSYAWNATWATGGSTVVRMAIGATGTNTGDPNLMKIIPIDTTVPGWETSSPYSTLAKSGPYILPVTLTPYIPTTSMHTNEWD